MYADGILDLPEKALLQDVESAVIKPTRDSQGPGWDLPQLRNQMP